jgi:hypothetical protein
MRKPMHLLWQGLITIVLFSLNVCWISGANLKRIMKMNNNQYENLHDLVFILEINVSKINQFMLFFIFKICTSLLTRKYYEILQP